VVGTEAEARDYAMAVRSAGPCEVEPHLGPGAGRLKFGVEIELRGLSEREVPANPLYAKLSDSEGSSYTATLAGCAPMLTATRIRKGETARGVVTFDVPEAAHGLEITYAPFIVGSAEQPLTFLLGR
jgi:hypothetical protein